MWSTGKLLNCCGNADILSLKRALGFREIRLASVYSHFVFQGLWLEHITMWQASLVPGKGDTSLQTRSRNLTVLAILAGATSERSSSKRKTSPLQWERRNFKTSGAYCSISPQASYNNAIEFLVGSLDIYHSFTYHWALRKHRFSLPQVSAIRN